MEALLLSRQKLCINSTLVDPLSDSSDESPFHDSPGAQILFEKQQLTWWANPPWSSLPEMVKQWRKTATEGLNSNWYSFTKRA